MVKPPLEDTMMTIEVFDTEAKRINKLADKFDTCDASIIDMLFEMMEDNELDIEDYLMGGTGCIR